MNTVHNGFFSKPFLRALFVVQNEWHQHGVFIHSLRVVYHIVQAGEYRFIAAGLLHDIGKPFVAYQKTKDIKYAQYSFTDHEEKSYQIIKNWPFLSEYTKMLVRYHYLIRDIKKHKISDPKRSEEKQKIWETLTKEFQQDLRKFMIFDDLGKGKKRR